MNNKIIKFVAIILVVCIILIGVILFAGIDDEDFAVSVDLYFYNESSTEVVNEKREITYNKTDEIISKIIEEIDKGPRQTDKKRMVETGIKLNSIRYGDSGDAVVDLKNGFLSGDSAADVLAAYTVIKPLCSVSSLTGVTHIKLTVEGEDITTADNKVLEYFTYDDIKLSDTDDAAKKEVVLYFKKAQSDELAAEKRTVEISDGKVIEQIIVEELINGPQSNKLVRCLDGKVLSVETIDGICFINFEASFADKNSGEKASLAIYSIVNSLTKLSGVDGVQILVEGKKIEKVGEVGVSEPLN